MVHTTSAPTGPPPVGAWAGIIAAVPAEGKIAASMAWGVEISDAYAAVAVRRGADAGLVATLAGRRVEARQHTAIVRQVAGLRFADWPGVSGRA